MESSWRARSTTGRIWWLRRRRRRWGRRRRLRRLQPWTRTRGRHVSGEAFSQWQGLHDESRDRKRSRHHAVELRTIVSLHRAADRKSAALAFSTWFPRKPKRKVVGFAHLPRLFFHRRWS